MTEEVRVSTKAERIELEEQHRVSEQLRISVEKARQFAQIARATAEELRQFTQIARATAEQAGQFARKAQASAEQRRFAAEMRVQCPGACSLSPETRVGSRPLDYANFYLCMEF
jgi:hypothetical protein